jgi:hypothetical protein
MWVMWYSTSTRSQVKIPVPPSPQKKAVPEDKYLWVKFKTKTNHIFLNNNLGYFLLILVLLDDRFIHLKDSRLYFEK